MFSDGMTQPPSLHYRPDQAAKSTLVHLPIAMSDVTYLGDAEGRSVDGPDRDLTRIRAVFDLVSDDLELERIRDGIQTAVSMDAD